MIQFNLKRFGKLACWTLTNDKRYFIKSFLQMFVALILIFLFFTMVVKVNGGHLNAYKSCTIAVMAILGVDIILGPALMFYSMEGKHDMQTLMMLPASNFEKYLVRNIQWMALVPLYVVAILGADLIQYVIHLIAGHDYGRFVVAVLFDLFSKGLPHFNGSYCRFFAAMIVLLIWFQSLYAVGATFFRSHKYNWVMTSVVLILGFILLTSTFGWGNVNCTWWNFQMFWNWMFLVLITVNYWLSYRQFCRTQVIGKYVNL